MCHLVIAVVPLLESSIQNCSAEQILVQHETRRAFSHLTDMMLFNPATEFVYVSEVHKCVCVGERGIYLFACLCMYVRIVLLYSCL